MLWKDKSDEMIRKWREDPKGLYDKLQASRNEHIFHGYSPYDFSYPIIEPTLGSIEEFIRNFDFLKSGIPEINSVFKPEFEGLLQRIKQCKDGVPAVKVDKYAKDRVVKFPYEETLRLCYDFVFMLELVYVFQHLKQIVANPKAFLIEPSLVESDVDTSNGSINLKQILNTISSNEHLTIEEIKNARRSLATFIQEKVENKNKVMHIYPQDLDPEQMNLKRFLESEDQAGLEFFYGQPPLPDIDFLIPECPELDVRFFIDTHGAHLYPVGVSFEPMVRADNQNMPPLDFFMHDAGIHTLISRSRFLERLREKLRMEGIDKVSEKEYIKIKQLVNAYLSSDVKLALSSDIAKDEIDLFENFLFICIHEPGDHYFSFEQLKKFVKDGMKQEPGWLKPQSPEGLFNFLMQGKDASINNTDKAEALHDAEKVLKKTLGILSQLADKEQEKKIRKQLRFSDSTEKSDQDDNKKTIHADTKQKHTPK
ncbi:MAG: hypothetical protein AB7I18_13990 [Candidatus Berkiella sp.]